MNDLVREETVLHDVHVALEREARLEPTKHPLTLVFTDGVLTLEGEVADVAAKARALRCAAAVRGVRWVVDRLAVDPGVPSEDGALRDRIRDALLSDTAFADCRIVVRSGSGRAEHVQVALDPVSPRGLVDVRIEGGVVTLDGDVPSWSHRRLAGVYAWWSSGTRNVHNGLGVTPPESDEDGELADAVKLALEKDPLVNASQIAVRASGGCVTLAGTVHTDLEREIAERDAWYVLGVDDVVAKIDVHP